MFICLQNCLNSSEIKWPYISDIIFFGRPYSEKINLHAHISQTVLANRFPAFLMDQKFTVIIYNAKVIFCYLKSKIF